METCNATVTVRYKLFNLCHHDDFGPGTPYATFEDLVKDMINEEGCVTALADEGEIIAVEHVTHA